MYIYILADSSTSVLLYLLTLEEGGLNCLTHALPRRLPTPTEEADGNGYGAPSPGGVTHWAAV